MLMNTLRKRILFRFIIGIALGIVLIVLGVFLTFNSEKNNNNLVDVISVNTNEKYNVKNLLDKNLDDEYEFYSNNEEIATIDKETGILYAQKEGETVIEITDKNDGKVVKKVPVKVSGEGISKPIFEEKNYTCEEGEVIEVVARTDGKISIENYYVNNNIVEIEEIQNSDCENCTKYQIKCQKEGTARIEARTKNNKVAVCEVTVLKKVDKEIPATGVSISPTKGTVEIGETINLVATISPNNATNKKVTWTSSDSSIATVSNGVVKGLKEGTVKIKVETENNIVSECEITVLKKVDKEILATGVSISPTKGTVEIGETINLVATISPNNVTNKKVTWTSSDPSIATVSNGVVKGLKEGKVKITVVTSNGKVATADITITKKDTIITITQQIATYNGKTHEVSVTTNSGETPKIEYYTDPNCSVNTDSTNGGANKKNGAPKNVGKYYVIVKTVKNDIYNEGIKSCTEGVTIVNKDTTITVTPKTVEYNGNTHEVVATADSGVKPIIKYYTDSTCMTSTTSTNSGAIKKNGAPKYSGTYYVQAIADETSNYNAVYSECKQAMIITPLVKMHFIRVSRNNDGFSSEDAILLQYDDKYAMIDTGAHSSGTNPLPSYLIKELGIKRLEFVLITHMHADHTGGLYYGLLKQNINDLTIGTLYVKQPIDETKDGNASSKTAQQRYDEIIARANDCNRTYSGLNGICVGNGIGNIIDINNDSTINEGYTINLGTNSKMSIKLYNTKLCDALKDGTCDDRKRNSTPNNSYTDNTNSIVEFITFTVGSKNYKVLLTGDLHDDDHSINLLYKMSLNSGFQNLDVMKAPHHGYPASPLDSKLVTKGYYNQDIIYGTMDRLKPKKVIITNYEHSVSSDVKNTINRVTNDIVYVQGTGTENNITQNYGVVLTFKNSGIVTNNIANWFS